MKNLAFIGNEIEKKIVEKWLKELGFRNLIQFNQIDEIAKINMNNSNNQNEFER